MIKRLLKKLKNYMYDIDALAQTRDFIIGKTYQWVNTPNDDKVATLVTVKDVFTRSGLIWAALSDGSTVSIDELNSKLMAVMDGQEALTKVEALSIRGPVFGQPAPTPATKPTESPVSKEEPKVKTEESSSTSIFSMFATEESLLNLNLRVNLPSINLLKLMYKSSQNKSEFLTQLASHINNQITSDHIKDALLKKLDSK